MIEIIKGDTQSITVILKNDGTQVDFESGDTVTMEVTKRNGTTKYIDKEVTSFIDGQAIINLSTTDTNLAKATYLYKIIYDKANGERFTLISNELVIK
jgi:hypothetical protein